MSNEQKDYIATNKQIILSQLECLPEGWRKTIIQNMVDELVDALGSHVDDFYVEDCKEKFGELRIYWCWRNDAFTDDESELYDKIEEIIQKYECISRKTCVKCGRITTNRNWALPYCEICIKFVN